MTTKESIVKSMRANHRVEIPKSCKYAINSAE